MDYLTRLLEPPASERSVAYIIGATVMTTLVMLGAARVVSQSKKSAATKIIRGPGSTLLPLLSEEENVALPYPPDVLPGGRDVWSSYGTSRVYEWGPETGRKVLLVHGITTPCVALGAVAHGLVDNGCRVMLLDLWGRGYSDTPADLEHDDRLYATQILIAITSSTLSWTGGPSNPGGFSLVGYSLGGGIAASFAASFPNLVASLVLIAPSGLIRPKHMSARSRFLYAAGIVPEMILKLIVTRRLRAGPMVKNENKKTTVETAVSAEVDGKASSTAPISRSRPDISVDAAVQWQVGAHAGFPRSFMSSLRFAPITEQHAVWRPLAARKNPILFFAGRTDPMIIPDELRADAEGILGADKVEWRLIEGAHDFPITDANEVVREMCAFWGM